MQTMLLIAAGGAIGAILRFLMSEMTVKIIGLAFPWGTIAVNLIGCFLIGLMWGFFNVYDLGHNTRLFIFVGVLGAFTTFSTFALENFNLFKDGNISMLAFNVTISNLFGVLLVFAGFYLSKTLFVK